jgi:hypothetical protein
VVSDVVRSSSRGLSVLHLTGLAGSHPRVIRRAHRTLPLATDRRKKIREDGRRKTDRGLRNVSHGSPSRLGSHHEVPVLDAGARILAVLTTGSWFTAPAVSINSRCW